jgi:hypothetical protein
MVWLWILWLGEYLICVDYWDLSCWAFFCTLFCSWARFFGICGEIPLLQFRFWDRRFFFGKFSGLPSRGQFLTVWSVWPCVRSAGSAFSQHSSLIVNVNLQLFLFGNLRKLRGSRLHQVLIDSVENTFQSIGCFARKLISLYQLVDSLNISFRNKCSGVKLCGMYLEKVQTLGPISKPSEYSLLNFAPFKLKTEKAGKLRRNAGGGMRDGMLFLRKFILLTRTTQGGYCFFTLCRSETPRWLMLKFHSAEGRG